MIVYFINIALIFFWAIVLLYNKPSDRKKKIYCGVVALQWIMISGLRDLSVGSDTYIYYVYFERDKAKSIGEILGDCWNYLFTDIDIGYKDPGYYLLQKIFQIFSDDYRVYLFFITILFTGLMAWWIYKNSKLPEISFLIYSILFYSFYSITGHRQTIATALVVFVGYELIKKKKYFQFAIIAFIAYMIHKSSIIFILYCFIANINLSLIYFLIMTGAIGVVALLGEQLYVPIALTLGFDENVVYNDIGGVETYATVLLLVCVLTFVLYPWISKRRDDVKYMYNMTFLITASTLLLFSNQSFMRIQQYFSLMIMITIPEIILSVEKKYRPIAYLGVAVLLILFFLRTNISYKFFFM